jgi:RNA polymerase sigma-70 factor (ECF subfamily)
MADTLAARLRLGDSTALEEAMTRYGAYAAKIISVFLGQTLPKEDMEEVLSDVFVALWRSRDRLEGEVGPYLAAIARNTARQRLRKFHPAEELNEESAVPDPAPLPQQRAESAEQREAVRAAVDTLAADDRELFIRFYYLEQTTAEIAAVTGMKLSTVKTRLRRGREKLRLYLTERGFA